MRNGRIQSIVCAFGFFELSSVLSMTECVLGEAIRTTPPNMVINMNRKLTTAVLLLVLIAFGLVGQTMAQSREIGVHVGDNFVYSINTIWSTNASATVPSYLVEINSTVFVVNVTAVQTPNVNATIAWIFSNGTQLNDLVTLDVDSGAVLYYIPDTPVFQGFYTSNLVVGERLRPTGNDSSTLVQHLIVGNYSSGVRYTNEVEIDSSVPGGTEAKTLYIDKTAGVLVEFTDYTQLQDQADEIVWALRETNLWAVSSSQNPTPLPSISEFSETMLLPVVAAMFLAVTLGVVAYRRPRHQS